MALMHNRPLHAALKADRVRQVLDVGCGVNADMTLLLAKQFPNAVVYGVDLSPVQRPIGCPKNVKFIAGNIFDLIESHDEFGAGSFDYIFSRLIVSGVHDLAGLEWFGSIDKVVSDAWQCTSSVKELFEQRGHDYTGMRRMTSMLQKQGLEAAQEKMHRVPWSAAVDTSLAWNEDFADYATIDVPGVFATATDHWWAGEENATKRESLKSDIWRTLRGNSDIYTPVLAVWAQKPERNASSPN